jgi:hypothetical protein
MRILRKSVIAILILSAISCTVYGQVDRTLHLNTSLDRIRTHTQDTSWFQDPDSDRPANCSVRMLSKDSVLSLKSLRELDSLTVHAQGLQGLELFRQEQNNGEWAIVYGAYGLLMGFMVFSAVEGVESRVNRHAFDWHVLLCYGPRRNEDPDQDEVLGADIDDIMRCMDGRKSLRIESCDPVAVGPELIPSPPAVLYLSHSPTGVRWIAP